MPSRDRVPYALRLRGVGTLVMLMLVGLAFGSTDDSDACEADVHCDWSSSPAF